GGETTLGIITTLRKRLNNTHKHEGIVRANALTKKKNLRGNEHDEILEQNMAKQQKKQKLHDVEDNKENTFYNNDKVELELSALKDTTNIWNNSST
ncbi:23013_t:CDS:2, partial [Gigaspora rosea]